MNENKMLGHLWFLLFKTA